MRMIGTVFIAVALAAPALAQAPPPPPANPCAEDIKKLCPEAKSADAAKCLQDNESKLSQACKDARASMRKQTERPN